MRKFYDYKIVSSLNSEQHLIRINDMSSRNNIAYYCVLPNG